MFTGLHTLILQAEQQKKKWNPQTIYAANPPVHYSTLITSVYKIQLHSQRMNVVTIRLVGHFQTGCIALNRKVVIKVSQTKTIYTKCSLRIILTNYRQQYTKLNYFPLRGTLKGSTCKERNTAVFYVSVDKLYLHEI